MLYEFLVRLEGHNRDHWFGMDLQVHRFCHWNGPLSRTNVGTAGREYVYIKDNDLFFISSAHNFDSSFLLTSRPERDMIFIQQ